MRFPIAFKSLELRQQSKSKNVEEQNQRASKLFKTLSPSYCSLATQWKARSISEGPKEKGKTG
jgi:hypothetical protein